MRASVGGAEEISRKDVVSVAYPRFLSVPLGYGRYRSLIQCDYAGLWILLSHLNPKLAVTGGNVQDFHRARALAQHQLGQALAINPHQGVPHSDQIPATLSALVPRRHRGATPSHLFARLLSGG